MSLRIAMGEAVEYENSLGQTQSIKTLCTLQLLYHRKVNSAHSYISFISNEMIQELREYADFAPRITPPATASSTAQARLDVNLCL